MWADISRRQHIRLGLRYPSDLRDAEWVLIEPMLLLAKAGGRPRSTNPREVMNAILCLATSGCQWRMLPKDFPPLSTVPRYFYAWRDSGLRAMEPRYRAPLRHRQGLCSAPAPLGDRAYLRMAWKVPTPRQRPGKNYREFHRMDHHRPYPPPHPPHRKPLPDHTNC